MQSTLSTPNSFTVQSESPRGLHVAIIMDGNGRWAARRNLPRVAGHRAGVAAVKRIVEHAPHVGIGCLTVYAFSSDNWRRPATEVQSDNGKVIGYRDLDRIGTTLAPVLLRRTKKQVLTQLPKRLDKNLFVAMTPQQRVHHEENREAVARIARWLG